MGEVLVTRATKFQVQIKIVP